MLTAQMRPRFVAVLVLVLTAIGVASLAIAGAQETPTPSASPQASPIASPIAGGPTTTAITVELVDIAFVPNIFTIAANTDVAVTLPNTGVLPHTFTVNDHNNPNVQNLDINVEVNPGETGTATINAPAGDYYFWCAIPGHEEAGMHGILRVQ
jgi:uncharacterized cupredoxin-like copper-binding protein